MLTTVECLKRVCIALLEATECPSTRAEPAVLGQALTLSKGSIAALLQGDAEGRKAGLCLLTATAVQLQLQA